MWGNRKYEQIKTSEETGSVIEISQQRKVQDQMVPPMNTIKHVENNYTNQTVLWVRKFTVSDGFTKTKKQYMKISWSLNNMGLNCAGPCSLFFFFFHLFFISWRLITLQYCSGFCHTLTWISHGFTCIPHPDPPSHLPLYPIPLGLPSAPAPSTCLMHPMGWWSVSP